MDCIFLISFGKLLNCISFTQGWPKLHKFTEVQKIQEKNSEVQYDNIAVSRRFQNSNT